MTTRTTIMIRRETREHIIKTRGTLEHRDGKKRTLEDVINEVLDFFEKNREQIK